MSEEPRDLNLMDRMIPMKVGAICGVPTPNLLQYSQRNSVAGAVLDAPPGLTRKELATVLDQHTPTPDNQQGPPYSRATRLTPNQVEIPCAECGTPIYYFPSQVGKSLNHFCDRLCLGKWRSRQTGAKAAHWKGGTRRDGERLMWFLPWHPRANNGYVYRYTIIAEWKLGRLLADDEIVHHKDEDQTNDHPDNLEVMTQSEHARLHNTLDRWSKHYDACQECGGTEREHEGHGLCSRCFQRVKKQRAA